MTVCRPIIRLFDPPNRSLIVCLVSSLALLVGCSEFRTIKLPENDHPYTAVAVGDTIQVITADAEKYQFEVVDMAEHAFHGTNIRIPYSEVRILSVERVNAARVAGLLTLFAVTAGSIHAVGNVPPPMP